MLFHQTAECTSMQQPRLHHPGSPLSTEKLKKKNEKSNDKGSNDLNVEMCHSMNCTVCIHIRNGELRHGSKQILRATSWDQGGIKHENKAITGKKTQLIYYRCESKTKQKRLESEKQILHHRTLHDS